MTIKQITSFYDFEEWLEGKRQHTKELEHENIELTIENRKLQRKVDELQRSQVEYINQLLNRKKSSAETDDKANITTASIPHLLRKKEYR